MKRFLWLGLVLCLHLICSGCGDTFRPIIIPNPPTFPNPAAAHTVVTISNNGTTVAGSAMVIDVTGDADVSQANVGLAPVHAVQQTANQVLVANQSVSGAQDDSLTKLVFSGTTINNTQTLSLPANSAPNFVAVAPTDTTAYVSLPNLFLDPNHPANGTVGVVNTNSFAMGFTITVGVNPVALAVTPDKSKLYVANQGDSTIGAFNTVDRSARQVCVNGTCPAPPANNPLPLSSPPIWLSVRTDNQRVYVLEQSGTLAYMDTTSTAGPDNLTETSISVPGAVTMDYDLNKNRLYIPGGLQVAIVDVSGSAPVLLTGAPIAIPQIPPSSRTAADPCSLTATTQLIVAAATALPDSSRAYIGAYYEDAQNNIARR